MRPKQKILIIVGPTSSGKSALAVSLARKFGGEVISADSRQVYRGLDIGTGKITKLEMKGVPHHLLDEMSSHRIFTAHDFAEKARAAVSDITARGKLPILAGGTGLYLDVLTGRVTLPNVPVNKKLRARLSKKTPAQLFSLLKKRDPERAKTIDPHNPRRLIRALEVTATLGTVPKPAAYRSLYNALWIGLDVDLSKLEKKIASRLSTRLKRGMLAEARKLHKEGLSFKRMEALGLEYRALARLLQKKTTRDELEKELFYDIRRFAKRQMTYWKRNKEIQWFKPKEKRRIEARVKKWL